MIKRNIMPSLEKELASDKVMVLTGMRRVGKTTLIRHLYNTIKDRRKVYLDLENPLNQSYFFSPDYDKAKVYLEQLAEGRGKNLVVFLDEIQNVKHIPSLVKYLADHYQIKFILTGSASFYLKNLFSESLAGRKRIFELYPLDFSEFLTYKAPNVKKPAWEEKTNRPMFDLLDKYLWEYLAYGGFPSVVLKESREEKTLELEDIFTSYFQKEIQLLADFRKLQVMKATILLLVSRTGGKIDISKIASELGVSRITIQEYIDFLEGTYFIKRIKPYSRKVDIVLRGQPKLYLCDSGFLTKLGKVPEALIFENTIHNLLVSRKEVYFYQSKGGAEIDFIIETNKQPVALEVKWHARPTDVRKLEKTAYKLGFSEYFVVSRQFSELPHVIYPWQL